MVLFYNKKKIPFFYSDETVGRQMLIYLTQYIVENYDVLPEITKLVDTTDIFLMPSMNPDGFNRSQVCIIPKYIKPTQNVVLFHGCIIE